MYKCIVLGITLEKVNGPGYGTNVHIFILGSCNILSFTNISLSMWEELWWQSARWIVRDVDRFWSSRQIARCPLRPGPAQGPQKLWDKWCKILHSRPLLALNFIIETSIFLFYFSHIFSNCSRLKTLFYYFWLYCGSDSGTCYLMTEEKKPI